MKPFVYVASPYTKGDPGANVHAHCMAFDRLLNDDKVVPYMPLWSHFQHTVAPRPYEDWIRYDNDIIDKFVSVDGPAAILRLNADVPSMGDYLVTESTGADAEVQRFKDKGLPVFYSIEDLYRWVFDLQTSEVSID